MRKLLVYLSLVIATSCLVASCKFHPAELAGAGWVKASILLDRPERYTNLRITLSGQWLSDGPALGSLVDVRNVSETIDSPAWTPVSGTVSTASFSELMLRPGDWTFTIKVMDGAAEIATFNCAQEMFLDRVVEVVAGGQSTSCTSDWGGQSVSVTVEPDLAVVSLDATPSSLLGGATANIAVGTQNQGTVTLGATVSLTATPPTGGVATSIGTPQSFTLMPEESRLVNFTFNTTGLPGGTYTLTATIATSGGDSDPWDDTRTLTIPIRIRDLAISAFTSSATAVDQGSPATLTVQITNNGTDPETPGALTITETPPTGTSRGTLTPTGAPPGAIAPAATGQATYTWNSTGAGLGNHSFIASLPLLAGETNTGNNVSSLLDVRVRLHDVEVSAVSAPTPVIVNCPATVSASTRSVGTETENASISLTDSLAATVGNSPQLVQASVGATTTVTFDWTPTAVGLHQVTASAAAVPGETNLTNNQAVAMVNVTAVVAPTVVSITPNTMQAGQPAIAITIRGSNFACPTVLSFRGPQSNNAVLTQFQRVDANTITANLTVNPFGPPQVVWDVIVTNPGALAGQLTNGLTVNR